ncbi:MAG: glycosyltransferase family 1 protein [bacterium]|nr:glycosyltransferase family 1 protein [bacterium]
MHIALDGSDLSSTKFDGTTVYVRELLPRLARLLHTAGHKVTVFSHSPIAPEVFGDTAEINVTRGRRFWTQTVLSRALFRVKPDLLFLPIQTVPLYRPSNLKVVATIHDLDFLAYPKMYEWKNRLLLRWFSRVVVRNATKLIAVSEYSRKEIMKFYGRSQNDISVVYHGFDRKNFRPPVSMEEKAMALNNIQRKYAIPGNTVLFVGAMQPRKNINRLIDAFELYKASGDKVNLVLVSGNGWREKEIMKRIQNSSMLKDIHVLRKVPYRDLTALYWNASVSVLVSIAEGFGLPVLEAMACGAPVLTSNTTALAEIAHGAALLVEPKDGNATAKGLEKILTDSQTKKRLIEAGFDRVISFSWDKCAQETAVVIEKALEMV